MWMFVCLTSRTLVTVAYNYFDRFFSDPVLFTEISLAARRNSKTEVPIHDAWRSEEVTSKRTWWASIVTDLAKDYSS